MTFLELLSEWWMVIFGLIISPYALYFLFTFFKIVRVKKQKKDAYEKRKNEYLNPITNEEKNLGIKLKKDETGIYKERIEKLIILLNDESGKVSINPIEAIMLIELYSNSVVVDENGILVIDLKTAKDFSKTIYHDPIKFMTYIKAIESKLDINNKSNTIELSEVLYMMRNAKKFGLLLDNDDTELILEMKSQIHESNYKDVVIRIVDDLESIEKEKVEKNIILTNTYKQKDSTQAETQKEKIAEPQKDENIDSIEKLDDDKIKVTTKDGTVIIKDDMMIYSVTELEKDEGLDKKIIHNNSSENKKEFEKLIAKEDTTLSDYIEKFGKLDSYEEQHKKDFKFKDRSKRMYDEQIHDYLNFKTSEFKITNFFKDEKVFIYFLSQLFNVENIYKDSVPKVFIGELKLKNKDPMRFISIDINYFLNFIYQMIKREDRESFFKFIYNGEKLNVNNVNLFIGNINEKYNLFLEERKESVNFLANTVYISDTTSVKTLILRIKIVTMIDLLQENDSISSKYLELKEKQLGKIKTKAFGVKAKETEADISLSQNTFFRTPSTEKVF